MRVTYRWLQEWVDLPYAPEELKEVFERLGIEVEDFRDLGEGLRGKVVTAHVVEVRPHPSLKLKVARLDAGKAGTFTVVTGAPNVREGMRVAHGMPGAVLPGGLEIGVRDFRGIRSEGMPLSEKELGLADESPGILELPATLKPGESPLGYLGLDDWLFDLYITPNRPDLMGVWGLARELGALARKESREPRPMVEVSPEIPLYPVDILEPGACPRYVARIVRGVRVGEAPPAIRYRLRILGQRSINNVVDATNYVLFELGHPTHVFDLDRLQERIVVRFAQEGERILCLDGEERVLTPEVLVIADAARPVAVAGIIGGEETGVTEATRNVLIESAYFDPPVVRRGSVTLKVRTESSARFERGVNPEAPPLASLRVAELILASAGGMAGPANDAYPNPQPQRVVRLRKAFVERLLGFSVPQEEIRQTFLWLGFETRETAEGFEVKAPPWRRDIAEEADLIEEIARFWGYDRVPGEVTSAGGFLGRVPLSAKERAVDLLAALGLVEVKTVEFLGPRDYELLGLDPREALRIRNPLGEEFSLVRTTLLPGLLRVLSLNLRRWQPQARLFEVGTVFRSRGTEELPQEVPHVGIALAGVVEKDWLTPERVLDLYDLKGVLEAFFEAFGLKLELETGGPSFLMEGRRAEIRLNGKVIGWMGQLRRDIAQTLDLKVPVWVSEFSLEGFPPDRVRVYRPLPKYPPVKRDISVLLDREVPYAALEAALQEAGAPHLRGYRVIDVYEGAPLPEGKKNITLSLIFQDPSRTLTEEEVEREFMGIVRRFQDKGYVVRGYESP